MRLSYFIIFLTTINVSASLYSQNAKLDFSVRNTSVRDVLKIIEKQTEFRFFFSDDFSDLNKRVSLTAQNQNIDDVLSLILNEGTVTYKVLENNVVVITPTSAIQTLTVSGKVTDATTGEPLVGVNVTVQGTTLGTITDIDGKYSINVANPNATLAFSFIGYITENVVVAGRTGIDIALVADVKALEEIVVVGYGVRKKESVTGSIAGVTSEDLDRVHASTVSGALAGKLAGVSFRMADGRPGNGATVQIRNMGTPLYVIDGFQKDEGTFNNISPNDIESISILKDATASVYGSRGANGVVLVTTKRGKTGAKSTINIDAYTGWQNWSRFPKTTNAYEWMTGKADAEMNSLDQKTDITAAELEKWRVGTEDGYKSFNWYDFIIKPNSPLNSVNVNATGGNEKVSYYISGTRLFQNSVLGRQFTFERYNISSSVDAKITKDLKVGMQITGRTETRDNPGVPGGDDYWAPRFALFRNRPTERPYANDNPNYINDIGHNDTNWALFSKTLSGYWTENWRVFQANFNADYQLPIKGLSVAGKYSYYLADKVMNGHEYTYQTYRYKDGNYEKAFGMMNPWRERGTHKVFENVTQGQINYTNSFGKHNIGAVFVTERIERKELDTWVHAVPSTNVLPLLYFDVMDTYNDDQWEEARIGYVGRINYDFARKYYLELSAREDASWKFISNKRWGFFPSVSAGWRISEEGFFKSLTGLSNVVSDFKLRASYGILGDDNVGIGAFDYLPGYYYSTVPSHVPINQTDNTIKMINIINGNVVAGARYKGEPVTNISWYTSKITDIGADFSLFSGKISGAVDYFYRKRTGLKGKKYDVIVPSELGYNLPEENVNSDAVIGGDGSIQYNGNAGDFKYVIGGNFGYARTRNLETYKPRFSSEYNKYRNSIEDRWAGTFWGYNCIGQFQSQEEINNYAIDNDGKGNRTMLPGDLKYEDVNKDGKINDDDVRP
ncbi:MAG TPA: SusC/RagA family TonB-linked outer membrane protein, partial [Bacteroidales bacterium]|nr:SusC/RagA family TonB-linked outer membrane protein [Bacteroidales bacterium]